MAKRNTGDKEGSPGTVIPADDTGGSVSLLWLSEAGVDVKAIKANWKASPNKGEYARAAAIKRIEDELGLRTLLMAYARKLLEKAIA